AICVLVAGVRRPDWRRGTVLAEVVIVLVAFGWFFLTTWLQRRALPGPVLAPDSPACSACLMIDLEMPPTPDGRSPRDTSVRHWRRPITRSARPGRSWHYYLSFADHGDTAGGHRQAAGPVVLLVHPDRGAFQDGHILVQDRVLDDGAAADPGIVQDHLPVHPAPAIYPDSRRQD